MFLPRRFQALAIFLGTVVPFACSGESDESGAPAAQDAGSDSDSGAAIEAGQDVEASVEEEAGADTAAPDTAVPETGDPVETGTDSAPPAEDSVEIGGSCQESFECKGEANCVSGAGGTPAHCTPTCETNADCVDPVKGQCGMCQDAGSFKFCVFVCGNLGKTFVPECTVVPACPEGPLSCDGVICG